MILKHQWVNDKIKEDILTYLEVNDSENTIIKDLWDAGKTVLQGKIKLYKLTSGNKKNLK